ncbi:hypothetical protein ACFVVC_01765 [Pseudarthrobacter sp. NPDC058196]|uniref:hypothetical protein n=1 Tax=Pseudarthrobacter sp. NPDC058196 TaxID=3346376 RepID=UPI0036DD128A
MKTAPAMDIQALLDDLDLSFEITADTQALISCGYFDAPTGIDYFSTSSMRAGLDLGRTLDSTYGPGTAAQYTVLVNDLGMDCSADACTLTKVRAEDIDISPLQEMAASYGGAAGVVREKTLRNRAGRKIKNWLKDPESDPTLRLDGNDILFDSDSYPRVLAGALNASGTCIPRCPLIVSEFEEVSFRGLGRQGSATSRIMFDFIRIADRDKVIKGTEMYMKRRARAREAMVLIFLDADTQDFVPVVFNSDDYQREIG